MNLFRNFALVCVAASLTQASFSQCEHVHIEPVQFAPLFAEKGASAPQKFTTTLNGVTISSDYDNGSLGGIVYSGTSGGRQVFDASLHSDQGELGPYTYWFRFKMDNVANGQYRVNLSHVQNDYPVIRFFSVANQEWSDWRRLTPSETPSSTSMQFDTTADEDAVELAFFYPLGKQETYSAVNALVDASPHASVTIPETKSFLGNDFQSITVNDTRFPDSEKHGVWVHSRAHAAEVTSTWLLLGYLEQFTADDEIGARLRRYCRLDMMSLINVDGVELGNTRWDAQGVDPERWADISSPGSSGCLMRDPAIPSQMVQKGLIDDRLNSVAPPEVALNLHSTQGRQDDSFFFQRSLGGHANVQQSFRTILQNYIDAFDNATPLFDYEHQAFSQLRTCSSTSSSKYVESYFYTMRGEATMAMTHEGTYQNRGYGDFGYWTAEEYKELGRAQARALVEYLNLPECDEPEADVSVDRSLTDETQAGNGITVYFSPEDPLTPVDLYAATSSPQPAYQLIASDITESSYNFIPEQGDGFYSIRTVGKNACLEPDPTPNSYSALQYNDIENSEYTTFIELNVPIVYPMTDDINIILLAESEFPFETKGTILFTTVSRTLGSLNTQLLDTSKLIDELVTIASEGNLFTELKWGVDASTNPSALSITTAYFLPEDDSPAKSYPVAIENGYAVIQTDSNVSGTWYLGESGAIIQEDIAGNTWAITE